MQEKSLQEKAEWVLARLNDSYGVQTWEPEDDPVDALIATILSANTNDVNSGRAFEQLCQTFAHDWDAVRTAPLAQIIAAIRPAGMYNQKAPAIVATLEKILADRGEYNLDFLAQIPVDEAVHYLTQFPGVGHKTASIVLLFCFNRAAFPVDTHVQRISQRIGIAPRKAPTEKVKAAWEALLPPETFYTLHLNLIQHGRQVCQSRQARCEICSLQAQCDYFNSANEWTNRG